jgi:hypothetical protein
MRERQECEVGILGRQVFVQEMPNRTDGGENVLVRKHDALGCTCGPRGIHDTVHIVRFRRDGLLHVVLAHALDLVNMHDTQALLGGTQR